MDRVAGELGAVASRWGVTINFVRFQKVRWWGALRLPACHRTTYCTPASCRGPCDLQVDAGSLAETLARKKNADLENQ